MKLHVADGLVFLKQMEKAARLLVVDVDSKDLSVGMSCPPPAFVEESFLQTVKGKLDPEGMFLLNLVCRSTELYNQVIATLKKVKTINE